MSDEIKTNLSRLREIGWSLWDPIGLREFSNGDWQDGGACADEYDRYLLRGGVMLGQGEPLAAVADYFEAIEIGHMGLSPSPDTRERAEKTARAISDFLATLSSGL